MSKADIKNAAITTVTVLVSIYLLQQFSFTSKWVNKALTGN